MNRHHDALPRRPDRAALVIAAVLAALGLLILWDVSHLRDMGGYSQVGPATVPRVIAFGLIGLAGWTAIAAFRNDFPQRPRQQVVPVIWIVGGLAAQMLLLMPLGFSIATGVLFAMTARGFGRRNFAFSLPFGILFSFAIWVVFSQLLKLYLPAGPLERLFF